MRTSKILLVLPRDSFSKGLKDQLVKKGYALIGCISTYQEAVQLYQKDKPDLVLLGIKLQSAKTGIHFAQFIQAQYEPTPFIYLLSDRELSYLPMAKLTQPAICLVQPINQATIFANIEIVLHGYQQQKCQESSIKIFDGSAYQQICIKDILFLKADHVYVEVFTKKRKIVTRATLQSVAKSLPQNHFIRTHRSYVVNTKHVSSWKPQQLLIDQYRIPLSRSLQKNVYRSLAQN